MYLKKGKRTQSILSMFLTVGAVLSMGFLAFAGLYLVCSSLPLAIVAFLLSGFIEWKVFGKSIYKGLSRLKLIGNRAEKHLLAIELNFYLDHYNNTNACRFLKDYYGQRENYRKTRSEEGKKKLNELREFFYAQALKKTGAATEDGYIDACLAEHAQSMLVVAKRGVWFLRFFLVISSVIGVGAAVVTAYAMSSAIVVFASLSATALLATVWPIAVIAGIGATFLFYYIITDIVKHDVLEKSFKEFRQLFKREQEESLGKYIFRLGLTLVVMAGLIVVTVFATVATAGTWWVMMKKASISLLPRVPTIVDILYRTIIVSINGVTDIIYALSTTLQTLVKLRGLFTPIRYLRQCYARIKKTLSDLKKKESWGQFLNPFRIVTKLIMTSFEGLIFALHVLSIGLTTDRLGNLDPVMVAVACTIPEALQDANFLLKEEKVHESNSQVETERVATITESDNSHDHDHGNFLLTCLKVILFPLILCSAIWHWGFSNKDSGLTLKDSIKQSFGIHEHKAEEQAAQQPLPLSDTWKIYRLALNLKKARDRLNFAMLDRTSARTKQECIDGLVRKSREIIGFVEEKTKSGETIENAIEDYLKTSEKEKVEINGHVHNGHVPNGINGHARDYSKASEKIETTTSIKPCPFDILNKRRTLVQSFCLFKKEKPTTTVSLVKQAFSLAVGG